MPGPIGARDEQSLPTAPKHTAIAAPTGRCEKSGLGPLAAVMSFTGLVLLAAGGVLHSVGATFHVWTSLPYQNAIWHGFVLAAAVCHYVAVLREVAT